MSEIIPAVLATSVSDFNLKLAQIPKEVKFVHVDILEEDIWADINIDFEVHLMVSRPDEIMARWVERRAKRIIVHKLDEKITKFRDKVEIGLGVELHTSLDEIWPLISQIDFLHLMSIAEIGAQGHSFEPIIFDRIKKVKEKFPELVISVDGGIDASNYQRLINAGVERLIVGSSFQNLWNSLTKK